MSIAQFKCPSQHSWTGQEDSLDCPFCESEAVMQKQPKGEWEVVIPREDKENNK